MPLPRGCEHEKAAETLQPYPEKLASRLELTLFPLDITNRHLLPRAVLERGIRARVEQGSPLATWVSAFLDKTFEKVAMKRSCSVEDISLHLPDPICMWYILTRDDPGWKGSENGLEDIRVEIEGRWTRGMCVVDQRVKRKNLEPEKPDAQADPTAKWTENEGNRINRIITSPGEELFGEFLLEQIFKLE